MTRMPGILIVSACLILVSSLQAVAQGSEPESDPSVDPSLPPATTHSLQFGVHAGGQLASNSAEFVTLPGVVSCQGDSILYGSTSGGGFVAGAIVDFAPTGNGSGFGSHIGASVQVLFGTASSTFEADERIGRSISPQGELSEIVSSYSIGTALSRIHVDPSLIYKVSNDLPLVLSVGPSFGVMLSQTFDQKEEIASPSDATYGDGRTERNVRSGDIGETSSMLLGAKLSVGYDAVLSESMVLRPELSSTLDLSGPVNGVEWKQHSLRLGVSLLFRGIGTDSTPLGPGVER